MRANRPPLLATLTCHQPAFFVRFGAVKAAGLCTSRVFSRRPGHGQGQRPLASVRKRLRRFCFARGRLLRLWLRILCEAVFQGFQQIDDLGRFDDHTRRCRQLIFRRSALCLTTSSTTSSTRRRARKPLLRPSPSGSTMPWSPPPTQRDIRVVEPEPAVVPSGFIRVVVEREVWKASPCLMFQSS